MAFEKDKIKGAMRTDFILSAEIIAITLGTVQGKDFVTQVTVLAGIAAIMTIGVYGLVAGIVKLDDLGLYLSRLQGRGLRGPGPRHPGGRPLADEGPVGGRHRGDVPGRRRHPDPRPAAVHHAIEGLSQGTGDLGRVLLPSVLDGLFGIIAGALTLGVVMAVGSLRKRTQARLRDGPHVGATEFRRGLWRPGCWPGLLAACSPRCPRRPRPHPAADEKPADYLEFVQEFTGTCVARQGVQILIRSRHPTRRLRVWLDRFHMGVGTGDRSRTDLAPGGEPEALGCSRSLTGAQEWRVVRADLRRLNQAAGGGLAGRPGLRSSRNPAT